MDPAHLNKLFSISNWLFLIPCYCQNSIGDLWNTLVPTTECRQSHLPICRMTRRRSISSSSVIPHFGGGRSVDNLISRYVGWRDVAQFPFQVIIPRFGGGRSVDNLISRYVGWRDVTQISFSSVILRLSDDEMSKMSSSVCLVQRCHQSKCLFSTNHQFQYIPKFPNVYSRFCFPFIYLHTTINTVVDNPFPQ